MSVEFPVRHVGIVGFPGAEILDITGPSEVLCFTSRYFQRLGLTPTTVYPMTLLAEEAGPVTTLSRLKIVADRSYRDVDCHFDTLIVPGGDPDKVLANPELRNWIIGVAPKIRRIVSICTGAFMLAESGLLDGRRATTHWNYCREFSKAYPKVKLEPDRIFIKDGNVFTSGGITSGIDLALGIVEEDWGQEVALQVARFMVVFLQRPGGHSQFSNYLANEAANRPALRDLQVWIMQHPAHDLRVEVLAERMAMSPRNFARLFFAETGMTPAKFVELTRTDTARHMLTGTNLSIDVVAEKSGFKDPERMRRAFLRQLGVNPSDYRKRFGRFSIDALGNARDLQFEPSRDSTASKVGAGEIKSSARTAGESTECPKGSLI